MFRAQGLDRAAFEFDCPKSQIEVVEVGSQQVGVTGCGKKAVYVRTIAGWVNNTGDQGTVATRCSTTLPTPK
jgi:hypothetical protein